MGFSRYLALLCGICLPILETLRRWNTNSYPPAILDDWFIGVFLLVGFWVTRRRQDVMTSVPAAGFDEGVQRTGIAGRDRVVLAAAWAFAVGIGYSSVFGHLRTLHEPDVSRVPHVVVFAVISVGWVLAIIAMFCAIFARGGSRVG